MSKNGGRILIVDDEEQICKCLSLLMERSGFLPFVAYEGESAIKMIRAEQPDVILLDIKMPGISGVEVLKRALKIDPGLPIIIITGYADIHAAVEAMRLGAYYYLAKPFCHSELLQVVFQAFHERALKRKVLDVAGENVSPCSLSEMMGPSDAVARIAADVARVAQSNFTVVILGETGVGKEVVARAIHNASLRSESPFVPIDCGAISHSLLESELFGHEKGAFTSANRQSFGKFEMAHGGTLFMDEIANMPADFQVKLLRTLQEKIIYRVGSSKPVDVDVRILVASNQDLQTVVHAGNFRHDLFFRLNEFTVEIPPLRKRKDDILYLAKRFLEFANVELNKKVEGFTESAINILLAYEWPGNARQLRSIIRRAVLLADDVVTDAHLDVGQAAGLSLTPQPQESPWMNRSLREIVRESTISVERDVLCKALRLTAGNKAEAARLLKIDYKTIHTKVKDYGIAVKGGFLNGSAKD